MGKYELGGKSVEVHHDLHVDVTYSKPNSNNKLRVSFYYSGETIGDHIDNTYLTISVDEIKYRKLSKAQKMINKLRPHTYSEAQTENLETQKKLVNCNVVGSIGGGSSGDLNFDEQLNNIDSWYSGLYKDIVFEAQKLAIKGKVLENDAVQESIDNQEQKQQLIARKKMSEYIIK